MKNKAQALTEFAIFGTVLLGVLGFLVQYGMRANYQQNLDMRTFRMSQALSNEVVRRKISFHDIKANHWAESNLSQYSRGRAQNIDGSWQFTGIHTHPRISGVNFSTMEDKPVIDVSDPYGLSQRSPIGSLATTIFTNDAMKGFTPGTTPDEKNLLPYSYYEINGRPYILSSGDFVLIDPSSPYWPQEGYVIKKEISSDDRDNYEGYPYEPVTDEWGYVMLRLKDINPKGSEGKNNVYVDIDNDGTSEQVMQINYDEDSFRLIHPPNEPAYDEIIVMEMPMGMGLFVKKIQSILIIDSDLGDLPTNSNADSLGGYEKELLVSGDDTRLEAHRLGGSGDWLTLAPDAKETIKRKIPLNPSGPTPMLTDDIEGDYSGAYSDDDFHYDCFKDLGTDNPYIEIEDTFYYQGDNDGGWDGGRQNGWGTED